MEDRAVEVAPPCERLVEAKWEVPAVAVEPALLLDEVQEQHARERGQGEGVAIGGAMRGGSEPLGEPGEQGPEGAEEAVRDALGAERFTDAEAEREGRLARRGSEPLHRGDGRATGGLERGLRHAPHRARAPAPAPP